MYKKQQLLWGLVFSLVSLISSADSETLEPMVITATRTAQTLDDTLASVSVITRAEIERRQVVSLPEILRGVPGLTVTNSGGLGKATSVFLRGTEADHVLVLIDGIRVGSTTLGTTSYQDLPIDQIERIEIVRGPRSSLYGSEAIGGVIQIFTRKGEGPLRPRFSVGGGTHSTYKVSGGLSGGVGDGWFNLGAAHLDTEGFNACSGEPLVGGCFTFDDDDDGYRNTSGSVRGGYRFNNGLEIEANILHVEGRTEFDGTEFSGDKADIIQQVVGGQLRYSPASFWDLSLRAGRSLDESDVFFRGDFLGRFDSERFNVTLQNDFELYSDNIVTAGFDFFSDSVESNEDFAEDSRYNVAGFGQYQGSYFGHDIILGVRYDENEQFGGQLTGNVGWGYALSNGLRFNVGLGSAFKAPTFNELYFPFFGNPNLDPEESWTAEAGLAGNHGGFKWSMTGYYTDIDKLITLDSVTFAPENIDQARIIGFEASVAKRLWDWEIAANFSYVDHENRGDAPNRGNELPRRPKEMFQLLLDRSFGRFSLGTTVYVAGRRFDDIANQERLGGFVTLDARLGFEVYKNLFLEARATNLLNKQYQTARFFNEEGTNIFASLRYQP